MSGKTNFRRVIKNLTKLEKVLLIVLTVVLLAGILVGSALLLGRENKTPEQESGQLVEPESPENEEQSEVQDEEQDEEQETETNTDVQVTDEDPQEVIDKEGGEGATVDLEAVIDENETSEVTHGIDVSKYQGTINWKTVADAGIDFVMVRVGYRTMSSGEIVADSNAKYNMQEAQKVGIKVGAYFFSTAVNEAEAIEEANWVADYVSQYKITYPVAYNCEGYQNAGSRQYDMSVAERTDVALAFMKQIGERGYTPMFYAAKGEMEGEVDWEVSRVSSLYKVWVAQYPAKPYPETESSSYSGKYDMWQYTNKGNVPGIPKQVDVNVAYFGYEKEQGPQNDETPENVDADVEALMKFTNVEETVTAKDKTNLRDKPSQGNDSSIIYVLENGEKARRTGVSDSGWSRLEIDDKVCYAVSSYLTTDLSYKPPQPEEDDGIVTEFTKVNEKVTAKEVVNLRTLPSVTNENSVVVAQITNGEVVTRTGINKEVGWSRVEYEGQTLYCISSYVKIVETE